MGKLLCAIGTILNMFRAYGTNYLRAFFLYQACVPTGQDYKGIPKVSDSCGFKPMFLLTISFFVISFAM